MDPSQRPEPRSPSRLRRLTYGPTNYHNEDYAATDYEGRDQNGNRRYYKPFSRGHYAGIGPKGYQRSDERLRELVCDVLTEAPDVDATEVEVFVKAGIVRLEGSMPSRRMKRITEDTIERIGGVMDIENNIEIK